ncbi:DUF3667 domain-containing protein [Aquimarina brevivitae]|uniref:Uncharacterized protein DUF3667 n=1 Tax=Aquimarina brevivitae TaxID=323412 RepID=A0A4Q7NXK5_9FLAO|nr:DUF3667 domain-containing protein [Aquimarina brevivitae]RZS91974.1 uncharacterized protein DUF3667 [Aquimarina brevivitae]
MNEKGRFLKKYRGNECLNCGVPLDLLDKYCHNCGQANTTKRLTLKDLFNEFFASIFSYDSRLRHTIVALLFKPGKISKDYIQGQRAKYANPFRFYLSVSIIFFILYGFFLDFEGMSSRVGSRNNDKVAEETLKKIKEIDPERLERIESERNINIDSLLTQNDSIQQDERTLYTEAELDTMSSFSSFINRFTMYQNFHEDTGIRLPDEALDSLNHKKTWFTKYLYKRGVKAEKLSDDPTDLVEFIFNKLPFIIFFFLPLLALAIWLLYIRRSFTYMEHLVFTFHTQTIFFILFGIALLVDEILHIEAVTGITALLFLFYLYKALRKFYGQGRFKTIVKFLILNLLFFILAGIGVVVTLVSSILLF